MTDIIDLLSPDDVRQLILAEDELSQCEGFTRIFPGPNTYTYFPYFENPRYYNMLFDAWEAKYGRNRIEGVERLIGLCRKRVHLDVEPSALNAVSTPLILYKEVYFESNFFLGAQKVSVQRKLNLSSGHIP